MQSNMKNKRPMGKSERRIYRQTCALSRSVQPQGQNVKFAHRAGLVLGQIEGLLEARGERSDRRAALFAVAAKGESQKHWIAQFIDNGGEIIPEAMKPFGLAQVEAWARGSGQRNVRIAAENLCYELLACMDEATYENRFGELCEFFIDLKASKLDEENS